MRGFAKIVIAGNLTRDPESRTTTSGRSLASFGVAVNRVRKDAAGSQTEDVNFYNCTAWGPAGENIAKYLHRGDPILVSGRPSLRTYQDRNGVERSSLDIDVDDFVFLSGPRDNGNNPVGSTTGSYASSYGAGNNQDVAPSDIPEGDFSLDNPFATPADTTPSNTPSAPAADTSKKPASANGSKSAKNAKGAGDTAPTEITEEEISLDEIPF